MKKVREVESRDLEDLWKHHSLWVILLIGAFAFDALSTIHFMTQNGIHCEIHPLVKYSALILGPVTGTILSAFVFKSIVTIGLALHLRRMRIWVLTAPILPAIIAGFLNFREYSPF